MDHCQVRTWRGLVGPGQVIPLGSTQVLRGQTDPYQGWVSHASLQMIPAPVVAMNRTGSSMAILTLIAPASPGAAVTAAVTGQSGGRYSSACRSPAATCRSWSAPTATSSQPRMIKAMPKRHWGRPGTPN